MDPTRFHKMSEHTHSTFGDDWFALRAEAFARFFGTPKFLVLQTVVVITWLTGNIIGFFHFDLFPFIFLNLAFSLQAAYAAPLILLAQTRQSDRDKALAEADAHHREAISEASQEREIIANKQIALLATLLRQNLELTSKVEELSVEIHSIITEKTL